MDPATIGQASRGTVGSPGGPLSSANEETKLESSKEKGLKPLMSWFESSINLELMPALDPEGEFEFTFVGFDSKSDTERAELATKQASTFKTVNEVRVEMGLEEREDCEVILNSVWQQASAMAAQQAQQDQQGADGMGAPGDQQPPEGAPVDEGAPGQEEGQGSPDDADWKSWAGMEPQKFGGGGVQQEVK